MQVALHSSELQTWTLKTASWPPALECLSDPPSSRFKISFPSPTCWSVNSFATIPCFWQLQAMLTATINQGNSMWSQGRRHTVRGKLTISVWTQGNRACPQIHLGVWSLESLLFTHYANQSGHPKCSFTGLAGNSQEHFRLGICYPQKCSLI